MYRPSFLLHVCLYVHVVIQTMAAKPNKSINQSVTTMAKLKTGILHTSKISNLLPVCLTNSMHLADHISEPYAKFY